MKFSTLTKALGLGLMLWGAGEGAALADAPDAGFVPKRERGLPPPGPWVAYDCEGRAIYPRPCRSRPRLSRDWSAPAPAPRYAARIYRDGYLYSPYRDHQPVVIYRDGPDYGHVYHHESSGPYYRRYRGDRGYGWRRPAVSDYRRVSDGYYGEEAVGYDAPALDYPHDRRCQHWSNRCAESWGAGGADYYGCLRYHSCD